MCIVEAYYYSLVRWRGVGGWPLTLYPVAISNNKVSLFLELQLETHHHSPGILHIALCIHCVGQCSIRVSFKKKFTHCDYNHSSLAYYRIDEFLRMFRLCCINTSKLEFLIIKSIVRNS